MGRSKLKKLYIRHEKVIDRQGNYIDARPEDIPALANLAKVVAEKIRTGQDYRII